MRLKQLRFHILVLAIIVSCGSGNKCEQACDADHDDCLETTVSEEVCQNQREACETDCSESSNEDDDTAADIIFCLLAALFGGDCAEEED